jgi:integrase
MLTDTAARKAAPRDKDYKLADAAGLYLYVTRKGAKIWRMKYRYGPAEKREEKRLIFGPYPEVSLTEARELRDAARRVLRDGKDPALERKKDLLTNLASSATTFEKVARQWHAANEARWSKIHGSQVLKSLQSDVFPELGSMPLRDIEIPMVLDVLTPVMERGSIETAHRLRQRISAVFIYAIAKGLAIRDPAPAAMVGAMTPVPKSGKQPALVGIVKLRGVLKAAEAAEASPVTKAASRLLALTAVRPSVVTAAQWDEFEGIDWDNTDEQAVEALWRVPASRMKLRKNKKDEDANDHLVPLPPQAVDVLRMIRQLTGRADYVFPNQRRSHKPMSENAIGYLYNREGYHGKHVPHGWRAAFSTTMNELAKVEGRPDDRAVIDLMLAHVPKNKVEAAYNRAEYWPDRVRIASTWADLITEGLVPVASFLEGKRHATAEN